MTELHFICKAARAPGFLTQAKAVDMFVEADHQAALGAALRRAERGWTSGPCPRSESPPLCDSDQRGVDQGSTQHIRPGQLFG
jgi:hypothetical protein